MGDEEKRERERERERQRVSIYERENVCVCVCEREREREGEEIRKEREIMLHVGIMLWVLILFESFNLLLVRRSSRPNLFTKGQLGT